MKIMDLINKPVFFYQNYLQRMFYDFILFCDLNGFYGWEEGMYSIRKLLLYKNSNKKITGCRIVIHRLSSNKIKKPYTSEEMQKLL